MQEKRLWFLFILVSFSVSAQIKGVVVDENNKPIPFVNIWVENENIGTTSEEDGSFQLNVSKDKNLIFSTIGFEKKTCKLSEKNEIILKPIIYQLDEVKIEGRKATEEIEIGQYNKSKINFYYGCWDKPWIIAKYISYTDTVEKKPFLKNLTIMTSSYKKNASFNLRFLEVNSDGSPGNEIINENILVKVKKGKENTTIDISKYKLKIPQNGIFISIEFLIIEENKYESEVYFKETNKKEILMSYQPSIGTVPSEVSTTWKYIGKWTKMESKNSNISVERYNNKFSEIAMKLTLTN
jgi:hypothetical protein